MTAFVFLHGLLPKGHPGTGVVSIRRYIAERRVPSKKASPGGQMGESTSHGI